MSCRFETYDAAKSRWNAAGTAGVRAEAGGSHLVGDRDSAAWSRAARDAPRRAFERAERRAVMRIQTQAGIGELAILRSLPEQTPGERGCLFEAT